jgi:cytochrome P450
MGWLPMSAGPAVADPYFDPRDPAYVDDPYPVYARLRTEAPVHASPLGFWMITGYDDVMALLRDERGSRELWRHNEQYLRNHPGTSPAWEAFIRNQVQFLDPPGHTRQRTLVSKAFTPRAVEARRPRVQLIVDDLLDARRPHGRMDVVSDVARPLPYRAICDLLGLPADDVRIEASWITAIVRGLSTLVTADDMRAASDALDRVTRFVTEVIDQRRSRPEDDLLSALIAAEDQGDRLADEELVALVINLFVGGSETTMNLIGSGLLSLLRFPDQLASVRADPSSTRNTVEECLRFESPAQFQSRTTLAPIEVRGVRVPPQETLFLCLASANRDERRWRQPDRFDITRTDLQHLAFGYGIHHCLGASLARLETQVALDALVQLPDLSLVDTRPAWGGAAALSQRGLRTLPVAFTPW